MFILQIKYFDNKGRGIIANRSFAKGEFVLEYIGELISMTEANKRELKYAKDDSTGCYMYYFKHNGQQYWYELFILLLSIKINLLKKIMFFFNEVLMPQKKLVRWED